MICLPCFSHSHGYTLALVITNHNFPDPRKFQASHHQPPTPPLPSLTPKNLSPLHYHYAFTSFLSSFNSIVLRFKHFLSCTLSCMSHLTGRAPTLVKFNFLPFLILTSGELKMAEEKQSHADWSHFNYDHLKEAINDV